MNKRSEEDEYLLGFIKQYCLKGGCVYRYRKIYIGFRATGNQCGTNRVYRLIQSERPQAQRDYKRKITMKAMIYRPLHSNYLIVNSMSKNLMLFG